MAKWQEEKIGEAVRDICSVENRAKSRVRELITPLAEYFYEQGRKSVIDEWRHEQKKMMDGFNHPKNCKRRSCKK